MYKLNLFKSFLIISSFSLFLTNCSVGGETIPEDVVVNKPIVDKPVDGKPIPKDDDIVKEAKYIVAFEENKVGAAESVDYVLVLDNLKTISTGSFDVKGRGIVQTGWRFFHQAKNTLFTAGYAKDVTSRAYGIANDNSLKEKSVFTYDSTLDCFTTSEDGSKMIAVQLSHGGLADKKFYIVDVASGKVENIVKHPIDIDKGNGTKKNPGSIPWVSGMVQKANKLYVAYFKWDAAGKYTTPITEDKAKVAIFNYPEMTLDKIIESDKTGPLGNNGADRGILSVENGDMYAFSCLGLSAGFTSPTTKKSGIVRIKKGEDKFDSDYFFNVEEASNGGKIFWMKYVGNNKVLARIIKDDSVGAWGAYSKDVLKMVILDLESKTVTDVTGVPNAQRQQYVSGSGVLIENGKIYTGITDKKETAVYIIDPQTATATKGAVATNANSIKGIFKLEK